MSNCEMMILAGDGSVDEDCERPACGTTEEGIRVCRPCGEEEARKGFDVKWDAPAEGQRTLFT